MGIRCEDPRDEFAVHQRESVRGVGIAVERVDLAPIRLAELAQKVAERQRQREAANQFMVRHVVPAAQYAACSRILHRMSTRMLIILALVCGLLILGAFAVQALQVL
jgi:hypothetical protein